MKAYVIAVPDPDDPQDWEPVGIETDSITIDDETSFETSWSGRRLYGPDRTRFTIGSFRYLALDDANDHKQVMQLAAAWHLARAVEQDALKVEYERGLAAGRAEGEQLARNLYSHYVTTNATEEN